MLPLVLSFAFAQEPAGFYHPDDIAQVSTRMAESSARLSSQFDERADTLRDLAAALRQYREGLELLGVRAGQAEWARLDDLEKQYHRDEAVVQGFADDLVGNFNAAMVDAMGLALQNHPESVRCVAELDAGGPRVPGMRGRTKRNPECQGENLNAAIAEAMDSNAELGPALDEMLDQPWPDVSVEVMPQPPVGEGVEMWASIGALVRMAAKPALKAINQEDDVLRNEVGAALEQADPDMDGLRQRVSEIEGITANKRSGLGRKVLGVAETRMIRWKADGLVGWCASPAFLGGCVGDDVSKAVNQRLASDKKFAKLLR